jgi:hypothetical protein
MASYFASTCGTEVFNIDNSGATAQIYTIIGSKGSTFAHNVQRWVGINPLAGPVPERFEDFGTLKREEGTYVLAPGADGFCYSNLPYTLV